MIKNGHGNVLQAFALLLLSATPLPASAETLASLYSKEGEVNGRFAPNTNFSEAQVGAQLQEQDALRTAQRSRAGVSFVDGIFVRLNENSQLTIKAKGKPNSELELSSGIGYFFSRESKRFPIVRTPVVTAALRGTEFVIETTNDRSVVSVLEGAVDCSNQFGSVSLAPGEQAITERGRAPVKAIMARPENAVAWAIYYPAFLDTQDFPDVVLQATPVQREKLNALVRGDTSVVFKGSDEVSVFGSALRAYLIGDTGAAFAALDTLPPKRSAGVQLFEAALNLSVGRISEANGLHEAVDKSLVNLAPNSRRSLLAALNAQRAIIALANNFPKEAARFADLAQANGPSISAAIAESYVRQSTFDLPGAIAALKNKDLGEPSAFARARLAELQLSSGEIEQALETIDLLGASARENAYALTIRGFAKLMRLKLDDGISDFEHAIKLDPAWGLPQLGLGLGLIRNGELEEGRHHLEMAVHLEPNISLYRSYLGKAYFEEERHPTALREYSRAIELDPKDPTPYLYRSFSQSALNRPVLALNDIEDSIARNDNRAVYRSKFGLDQDLAVRTSGLGGVFNGLGFSDAGRIEALKSVNRSYLNQAGHYLLADSDTAQPNLSQASGSEILIGRLLSPVNFNTLARGSSLIGAGLNEFSSLFDRPVSRAYFKSTAESKRKLFDNTVSGSYSSGRFGAVATYENSYSDGYRDNDYQQNNILTSSFQGAATADDFLLLDLGASFIHSGDTSIGIDPNLNDPNNTSNLAFSLGRLGYRHTFTPQSTLLSQAVYGYTTSSTKLGNQPVPEDCSPESITEFGPTPGCENSAHAITLRKFGPFFRWDAQQVVEEDIATSISGFGIQNTSVAASTSLGGAALSDFGVDTSGNHDDNSQTAYQYFTIRPIDLAELSLGVNYTKTEFSLFDSNQFQKEKTTPRFALSVYPLDSLVLRGAYFQTLAVDYSSDFFLIEPTNIGLFNQLYYDQAGTPSENYSVAADFKLAKRIYVGVEGLHRYLSSAPLSPEPEEQSRVLGYLSGVLSDEMVATSRYEWYLREDQFSETTQGLLGNKRIETHKISQDLRYFHPDGWFSTVNLIWRYQDYNNPLTLTELGRFNGNRDFFTADAAVGYLFKKRAGQVSLDVQNLFDRDFIYDSLPTEDPTLPGITVLLRISVNT